MKYPETADEILKFHDMIRSDLDRYMEVSNKWIQENPQNSGAYFKRHFGWLRLGEPLRALDDLNMVIEMDPMPVCFLSRGGVYRRLGAYNKALEDYGRSEAMMDSAEWEGHAIGLLYQADCHAHLGNEQTALACCARLPDDFWTPGLDGGPLAVRPRSPPNCARWRRRHAARAREDHRGK